MSHCLSCSHLVELHVDGVCRGFEFFKDEQMAPCNCEAIPAERPSRLRGGRA